MNHKHHLAIATAVLTCALIGFAQSPALAKACVQLTGGACQGHWACTTDDGSKGFCTDPPSGDCYCKKGAKSRHHHHHADASMPAEAMPPSDQMPNTPDTQKTPDTHPQDQMPGNTQGMPH